MSKYPKGKGIIQCPFHKEKTPSCLLDFNHTTFQCFSCEAKGNFKIEFELTNNEYISNPNIKITL